jgi:hypothetical protein
MEGAQVPIAKFSQNESARGRETEEEEDGTEAQ